MSEKKQVPLYWVREFEDDTPRLCTSNKYHDFAEKATDDSLTADALAEMMSQDAEGDNYHDFVGAAEKLIPILRQVTDEAGVVKVLRSIVDRGGFHCLARS